MRLLLGLAVALVALGTAVLLFAGRALVAADPLPAHADAIVILAGSVPDRTLEAVDLYHAGIAPRVVVTRERLQRGDAALHARGVRLPESADEAVLVLRRLGVPESAIVVLRRPTTSTETEARTIARYVCRQHFHRVVVVTWKAHSRRARWILTRAFGPGVEIIMRPTRYDYFSPRRWWRVRRDSKIALLEWEKLLHYLFLERWQIEPCGGLRRIHTG